MADDDRDDTNMTPDEFERRMREGVPATIEVVGPSTNTTGQPDRVAGKRGWRIGRISRLLSPGFGWCYRCRTTWLFVEGHATPYRNGSALFPLCEKCWSELTPLTRLPFYRRLWDEWLRQGSDKTPDVWVRIHDAVMEGK